MALDRRQKAQRMAECEALMVRRLSIPAIEMHLARQWGISSRQVGDYILAVRQRWAKEAPSDTRLTERAHMRASLNDLYARAMSKTEVVRDAAGNPILDQTGQPLRREVPDLRAATRVAETLCRLDGLYQDAVKVEVSGAVDTGLGFVGRTREELIAFAKTGRWPDPKAPTGA